MNEDPEYMRHAEIVEKLSSIEQALDDIGDTMLMFLFAFSGKTWVELSAAMNARTKAEIRAGNFIGEGPDPLDRPADPAADLET